MTKEDIFNAARELHYSEKLDLAQKLIQVARKDLEQITCQFQPKATIAFSVVTTKDNRETTSEGVAVTDISLDDIIARLKKLNCKKERTMLNSIKAMYQFRGGITEENAKIKIKEMMEKKVLCINENGTVTWNENC